MKICFGRKSGLFMKAFLDYLKSEIVLVVSALAALVSACFVRPSADYLDYLDWRVLALLFCLMAVVAGLGRIGVFQVVSQALLRRAANIRVLSLVLVWLCFFSSMLITNDVALITFVPLALTVLSLTDPKTIAYVVTLQTTAANLGSMLTPVGNPQNLYLYAYYSMSAQEFFKLTLPLSAVSFLVLTLGTLLVKPHAVELRFAYRARIGSKMQLVLFAGLFCLCIASVLGGLHYLVTTAAMVLSLLVINRRLFRRIDYGLLLTFVCFFMFVGNMGKIEVIRRFVAGAISGREFPAAILLSQVISNVPAAVMLSTFTQEKAALLIGTNLGGLGTLVASLASLISFKQYTHYKNSNVPLYMTVFTAVNLVMLLLLAGFVVAWY